MICGEPTEYPLGSRQTPPNPPNGMGGIAPDLELQTLDHVTQSLPGYLCTRMLPGRRRSTKYTYRYALARPRTTCTGGMGLNLRTKFEVGEGGMPARCPWRVMSKGKAEAYYSGCTHKRASLCLHLAGVLPHGWEVPSPRKLSVRDSRGPVSSDSRRGCALRNV